MPSTSLRGINKVLRRFRRNQRGASAIEFALVAPLFFALLFAILETALMFFASQVLETTAEDSARLIFTNQAQDQGLDADKFKEKVCANIPIAILTCAGITVDVKVFPQFSTIKPSDLADPIDASGKLQTTSFAYSNPPPGSTVVFRAFYQWPLYVTQLGYNLANLGRNTNNAKRLLTATAAFRVEPGGTPQ
jgi:Flp pilus assembly protein TadG